MFNLDWFEKTPQDRILQVHGWREHAMRLVMAAYLRADANLDVVKSAFHRLMTSVPREDGPDAVAGLRRLLRVMNAFAGLSDADREVLHGRLPHNSTWCLTGEQVVALRNQRQAEIFASHPDLAEYRATLDADAERAADGQRREREAYQAALQDAEAAMAAAPGIVLGLHEKGVRLDVTDAGRAIAFPASKLEPAEAEFLAGNNAIMADAIRAAWTA